MPKRKRKKRVWSKGFQPLNARPAALYYSRKRRREANSTSGTPLTTFPLTVLTDAPPTPLED